MDSREILTSKPGLCIKEMGKYGKGVFAERDFKSGECVFEARGVVASKNLSELRFWKDDTAIQIGYGRYLIPHLLDPGAFINHSCDPNCGIILEGERVLFIAIHDIGGGEEITFDYSTSIESDSWTMNCRCGSKNCRGVIGEFRLLPNETQQRYIRLGIVPEHVLERM